MDSTVIKDTAFAFLNDNEQLTAVIATTAPNNTSHAATIYYQIDDAFNFYFLTATNTEKYTNLLANSAASIVVGFGPSYTTIQGDGTATLIEKASEEENNAIARLKKRLQDHNNETWPIFQLDKFDQESIAVFKFTPHSLRLLNLEKNNGLTVTEEDVQHII